MNCILTFELDDKEQQAAQEFMDTHSQKCNTTYYSYIFTPTAIATAVKIECSKCGGGKDISNYDNW